LTSIYDVSHDCLHPTLDSTYLAARFGHESGFSPDGNTFWISGAFEGLAAVDVSDPKHPKTIWQGNEFVHGLSLSDDGDTAYAADPVNGDLTILNVSQIQNRVPNPQVSEVSRLTWNSVSIPQNAYAMQIDGHPYLLEFDEFAFRFNPPSENDVGAARIIDIADPAHPRVVSNIRLAVNQPAAHLADSAVDPEPFHASLLGYSAHYCSLPREVDPEIVACSFTNSGLRVFNIQDPTHPREVAYYVAPRELDPINGLSGSNFAMSKAAFDPATREVYYTDAASGFYVLKLSPSAWPDPTTPVPAPTGSTTKPAGSSCPAATGSVHAATIGPVALGQTRRAARRAMRAATAPHGVDVDSFCLTGGAIRAFYGHSAETRGLPRGQARQLVGRVVLALTANPHYSIDGVRPGSTAVAARRGLSLGRGYRIGRNTWYVQRRKSAVVVLRARSGKVAEIGVANRTLTSTRARVRRFLGHLG
jgi:hypothetical protein